MEKIPGKLVRENTIKNLLVVVIAAVSWPAIQTSFNFVEKVDLGNLLTVISILLVTVSFANFAFTYKDSTTEPMRMLSHLATFLFLLLTALLLMSMVAVTEIMSPSIYLLIRSISILLYVAVALYDFWDIFRMSPR